MKRLVQNRLTRADSKPITGRSVSIQLSTAPFAAAGQREILATTYAQTDTTGLWTAELEVNADLDPTGTFYTVREGQGVIHTFVVPTGSGSVWLRDILVVDPPPVVDPPAASTQYVDTGDASTLAAAKAYADEHSGGGGGAVLGAPGLDLWLVAGQSNAVGQGRAFDQRTDPPHPRVWTYNASGPYADSIVQAAEPLSHPADTNFLGFAVAFARQMVATMPANRGILLVPVARNATAFRRTTSGPVWARTAPNDGGNLYENAIRHAQDALSAAGQDPDHTPRVAGILWGQGESDAQSGVSSGPIYQGDLLELIDGWRNRFGDLELPFAITPMLPEFVVSGATAAAIDAVHRSIPQLRAHTAFVASPGFGFNQSSDGLHWDAVGQRHIGMALPAAVAAAVANTDAPPTVAAEQPDNPYTGDDDGSGGGGDEPVVLPGAVIADDFARSDSATVGPSPTGGVTPTNQAMGTILNGHLKMVGNSDTMQWPTGPDDYTFKVTAVTVAGGDAVCVRRSGSGWLYWEANGTVRKFPGTVVAELSSTAGYAAGDVLKVKCVGSVYTLYRNGTQVGEVTDNSNPAGDPGILVGAGGSEWDDMSIAPI